MAEHLLAVSITQVHAAATAVTEKLAVGTFARTHPLSVTIRGEALFPDVHEVIAVDVALMVVGADAGAGRDATVHKHRAYGDARLTGKEP